MSKLTVQQRLDLIDAGIAKEEGRLAAQATVIAALAKDGRDTSLAEALIGTIECALNHLRAQRDMVAFEPRMPEPPTLIQADTAYT